METVFIWDDFIRLVKYEDTKGNNWQNSIFQIGDGRIDDNQILYGWALKVIDYENCEIISYNEDWSDYTVIKKGNFDDLKWEMYYNIGNDFEIKNVMTKKDYKEKFGGTK